MLGTDVARETKTLAGWYPVGTGISRKQRGPSARMATTTSLPQLWRAVVWQMKRTRCYFASNGNSVCHDLTCLSPHDGAIPARPLFRPRWRQLAVPFRSLFAPLNSLSFALEDHHDMAWQCMCGAPCWIRGKPMELAWLQYSLEKKGSNWAAENQPTWQPYSSVYILALFKASHAGGDDNNNVNGFDTSWRW